MSRDSSSSVSYSISSSGSGSYTSTSNLTSTTDASGKEGNFHNNSADSYWSTDKILARDAARNNGFVSAPPNSTTAYEPKRSFTPYVSLGPVIGMVTDTTARILIESSSTCNVKCFLTDKYGVQHGCTKKCERHIPTVFQLEELRANTYYKITFDIPVPGLVKSGFKTLPSGWNISKHPPRIAIVSTNDFASLRDKIPHKNDLWKHLYLQCKRGDVDYILHLGNVAFVDADPKSGKNTSDAPLSAYQEAIDHCKVLHGELLADSEKRVCEIFRGVYRDTWSHPTTRHVLANAPNMMILNDHEIKAGLGAESVDISMEIAPQRSFIDYCAYKVYNEYCRALFENVPYQKVGGGSLSSAMKVGQAYHFHAFGDMGFVFIDTRAQRTLHQDWSSDDNLSFLGNRQWSDLEYALAHEGYLCDCRVLLVCLTTPVAQSGVPAYLKAGMCRPRSQALANSWNSPGATGEASLLLSKLFDWKAQKAGKREVMIVSGSSSDAGITEILDLRYKAKGDQRVDRLKQVVAGPTGALPQFKSHPSLSQAKCGVNGLGIYHQFKHLNIIKVSNYAIVDISKTHGEKNIAIDTYHVIATSKMFQVKKQPSSTYRAGGCWAAEADDAGVRGIRHQVSPSQVCSNADPSLPAVSTELSHLSGHTSDIRAGSAIRHY